MKATFRFSLVVVFFIVGFLTAGAWEKLPSPVILPDPPSLIKGGQSGSITLAHVSSKPNKIIDEENWWKTNELKTGNIEFSNCLNNHFFQFFHISPDIQFFGFQIMPGDVYYVTQIPSELELADVVTIGLAALILTSLATLYPARRAARVNPAVALRYE